MKFIGNWRLYVEDVILRYSWPRPDHVCRLKGTACYNVDPLLCRKCHDEMRITSFEDSEVIRKILKHLD